jgi:DNA repair photolyase
MTRNLLNILKKNNFKIHILTKSDLILRDLDILSEIKNLIITISIISMNENISNFFEKNVPSSLKRLKIIKKLSNNGIKTGLAIIPVLPYIIEDEIEDIIKLSIKYKSKYLLFKFLELKGYQKNIFFDNLKILNNDLLNKYINLYKNNYLPNEKYIKKINNKISIYCKKYGLLNNI